MEAVAYSTFRNGLRGYMDKVRDDSEPIVVTAKDPTANAVLINAADYENLLENIRIFTNKELCARIDRSIDQFKSGGYQIRDMVEVEGD